MTLTVILIILLALACLTVGFLAHYLYARHRFQEYKMKLRTFSDKAETLSANYDEYRKKYLDLDDRFQEVKNMEQTYRVAYQEWKQKYESLEEVAQQEIIDSPQPAVSTGQRDDEDDQILYISWKRKAKKWEKDYGKLQKNHDHLQTKLDIQQERMAQIEQLESELVRVKADLTQIVSNINSPEFRGAKGNSTEPSNNSSLKGAGNTSSSDVFDITD